MRVGVLTCVQATVVAADETVVEEHASSSATTTSIGSLKFKAPSALSRKWEEEEGPFISNAAIGTPSTPPITVRNRLYVHQAPTLLCNYMGLHDKKRIASASFLMSLFPSLVVGGRHNSTTELRNRSLKLKDVINKVC